MVRQLVRDRAAAENRAAVAANLADLPYDRDANLVTGQRFAVCTQTGETAPIDVGFEFEDAPVECPVCGADGIRDDVDTCTDAHGDEGDVQSGRSGEGDVRDSSGDDRQQAVLSEYAGGDD